MANEINEIRIWYFAIAFGKPSDHFATGCKRKIRSSRRSDKETANVGKVYVKKLTSFMSMCRSFLRFLQVKKPVEPSRKAKLGSKYDIPYFKNK